MDVAVRFPSLCTLIQLEWGYQLAFTYVHYADHNSGSTRPLNALEGSVNNATVRADPPQPRSASVPLRNTVCRYQAQSAVLAQHVECAPKEMSNQVRLAVAFLV